jgi:hypothetical protein
MQQLENQLKITYLHWIDQHLLPPTLAELCGELQLSAAEFEAYFGAVARIDTKIWRDIMNYTLYLTAQHANFAQLPPKQQVKTLFYYLLAVLKKHQNFVRISLQSHGLVDMFPKPMWLCVLEVKKQLEEWVSKNIRAVYLSNHPAVKGFSLPQLVGLQFGILLEKFLEDDGTEDFLHTQASFEGGINFIFRIEDEEDD